MQTSLFALLYFVVLMALSFLFLYFVIKLAVSAGVQDAVKKLKDQGRL